MPWRPPVHDPRAGLHGAKTHTPKADRQSRRYLHTGSAQWRAIRKAQLEQFPLCERCGAVAREVDHREGDTVKNRIGVDLASLCTPCHSAKTRAEQNGRPVKVKGCDEHGLPLDPNHPWRKEEKSRATDAARYARPASRTPPRIGES